MHNFRQLNIWKKALQLAKKIVVVYNSMSQSDKVSLWSQINRSAVSIPSNIAEGSARSTNKDFCRFLDIALGSAYELETQLMISQELNTLDKLDFEKLITELNELQKMIVGFKKTLS